MSCITLSTCTIGTALITLSRAVRKEPVMFDPSVPLHCRSGKPIQSSYEPTGREWTLHASEMKIYETQNKASRKIVIAAYDIFGFHSNTKELVDLLAQKGNLRIVMPDYFREMPFDLENFPPKDMDKVYKFMNDKGAWSKVKRDTLAVIEHFKKTENVTNFGIIGVCWGGKVSQLAASELDDIKVAGIIHPVLVEPKDAESVKVPTFMFASRDEPDMIPFYNILRIKFEEKDCGHRRFDHLHHGFASARGNYSDPSVRKAVNDILTELAPFIDSHLN